MGGCGSGSSSSSSFGGALFSFSSSSSSSRPPNGRPSTLRLCLFLSSSVKRLGRGVPGGGRLLVVDGGGRFGESTRRPPSCAVRWKGILFILHIYNPFTCITISRCIFVKQKKVCSVTILLIEIQAIIISLSRHFMPYFLFILIINPFPICIWKYIFRFFIKPDFYIIPSFFKTVSRR